MPTQRFYQRAFEESPVAILVVNALGEIVELNGRLEVLFGYSRAQLLGQPVELLLSESAKALHVGLRGAFVREAHSRPMGAGRDLFGRHQNGEPVPVEIALTPMRVGDDTYVLASVIDLSERKRAEARFRLAIEAAPNGMMLVDERGTIVLVNAQIERFFGYSRDQLVGQPVERLLPARYRSGANAGFFTQPHSAEAKAGHELVGLRQDGSEFPVEIGLSPLQMPTGNLVLSSVVDITERVQAQAALRSSLTEKEILLRELHHRAKNNLQLIASVLHLAASQPERSMADILAECRSRIGAIALVHEQLYQAGTFSSMQVGAYLTLLTEQVAHAYAPSQSIRVRVESSEVTLPLDQAVPVGLIVNELTTNALKHAFPNRANGVVTVRCVQDQARRITLSVHDDGVGLPSRDPAVPEGHLGLTLVRALARQLRATVSFSAAPGTLVEVCFEAVPGEAPKPQ